MGCAHLICVSISSCSLCTSVSWAIVRLKENKIYSNVKINVGCAHLICVSISSSSLCTSVSWSIVRLKENNIYRNVKINVGCAHLCVFFTLNWLTLTPKTHVVQHHLKLASHFLSWGKNKHVTLGMRLLWENKGDSSLSVYFWHSEIVKKKFFKFWIFIMECVHYGTQLLEWAFGMIVRRFYSTFKFHVLYYRGSHLWQFLIISDV